jgi:hypothetical protein
MAQQSYSNQRRPIKLENRSSAEGRPTLRVLEPQLHPQKWRCSESLALTPERRRHPDHSLEIRPEHCRGRQVRRKPRVLEVRRTIIRESQSGTADDDGTGHEAADDLRNAGSLSSCNSRVFAVEPHGGFLSGAVQCVFMTVMPRAEQKRRRVEKRLTSRTS